MADECTPYITQGEGSISSYCVVTPECPEVIGVPAHIDRVPFLGWNAGANSMDEIPGNLRLVFTMPTDIIGVVIGLRTGRAHQIVPDFIEHAFSFSSVIGVNLFNVVERGVARTTLIERGASDTFEIRRLAGHVTYWHNNALLYVSGVLSGDAEKLVTACLFASGDNL